MTANRDDGKYVRVYYRITDDLKFETIYGDDRHLATWLRLLLVADGIWPVSPPIPRTVRRASLQALVTAGLIDLMPQDCYRIHGLESEREHRAQSGRNAAAKRWDSGPNAVALPAHSGRNADPMRSHSDGNADPMLVRERVRERVRVRAEDAREQVHPQNGEVDPYDEAVRWLASRKAWVDSPKIQAELARLVDRKGLPAVLAAMAAVPGAEDAAQFVYGARNVLFPLPGSKVAAPAEPDPDTVNRLLAERRADREAARNA